MNYSQNWMRLIILLLAVTSAVVLLSSHPASAIARGYATDDTGLQAGMVAALSLDSSSGKAKVERAIQAQSERVVGIVTTVANSLVIVGSSSAQVLVENEGQSEVYVSDINGQVKSGDLLVLSPLKGVLMRSGDPAIGGIGIATDTPQGSTDYSYQAQGHTRHTNLAKVRINLNQKGSGAAAVQSDTTITKIGWSLVGKQVSKTRAVLALVIFLFVLIAEGGIIYGAVSSAITGIGRNPLASRAIKLELIKVAAIALAILAVGMGIVYAVLKL